MLFCFFIFVYTISTRSVVKGHGRLVDPPARSTMWRLGFNTPINYNDHQLFCGGFRRQWIQNNGRCGECGDPWDVSRPRPNESGGEFGTGTISKVYRENQVIMITVHLTANHMGWFEFRLCKNNNPKQYAKQSCFNKNVLRLVDYPGTRFQINHRKIGLFRIRLKLPEGVVCEQCVLQWHYTTGNNWGFCADKTNRAGCGPQEVFRGCSDIRIFSGDDPSFFKYLNLTGNPDINQFLNSTLNDKQHSHENHETHENAIHKHKSVNIRIDGHHLHHHNHEVNNPTHNEVLTNYINPISDYVNEAQLQERKTDKYLSTNLFRKTPKSLINFSDKEKNEEIPVPNVPVATQVKFIPAQLNIPMKIPSPVENPAFSMSFKNRGQKIYQSLNRKKLSKDNLQAGVQQTLRSDPTLNLNLFKVIKKVLPLHNLSLVHLPPNFSTNSSSSFSQLDPFPPNTNAVALQVPVSKLQEKSTLEQIFLLREALLRTSNPSGREGIPMLSSPLVLVLV